MLSVEPIKAYDDNYIWLISTNEGSIVVDPGESEKIIKAIDENRIDLKGILITHHHYDHTNGLKDLLEKNELDVYGPINNINGINKKVSELDKFSIIGIEFEVVEIPGHTLDHIAFYSFNNGSPVLFCGDTLFAGGCGRVFEGTYEQMFEALKKISKFPKNTKIYCGHEYTKKNSDFCLSIDTKNLKLKNKIVEIKKNIQNGNPTIPTILGDELECNIFLRSDNMEIQKQLGIISKDPFKTFAKLRDLKDNF